MLFFTFSLFPSAIVSPSSRDVKAADARGAILLDLLVYDLIGTLITLQAVFSGVLNLLGWGVVVVYLFITAGSAYLLLREKPFRKEKPLQQAHNFFHT